MYRDLVYRKESMKNSAAIVTMTVVSMVMTTIYWLALHKTGPVSTVSSLLSMFVYNFTPKILLIVYVTGCYGNPKATWLVSVMYGLMMLSYLHSVVQFIRFTLPHLDYEYYDNHIEDFLRLLWPWLHNVGMVITLTMAIFGSLNGLRSKGLNTTPGVLLIVYCSIRLSKGFMEYVVNAVEYLMEGLNFFHILKGWHLSFLSNAGALAWGIALVLFSRNKIPGVFPGAVRQDVEDAIAELDNRYTSGHMDEEVYDRRLEELAAKLR